MKIGITGQSGFIGSHLFDFLNAKNDKYSTIPFDDRYFDDEHLLDEWVVKCDVIVHLAAMSRHVEPTVVYNTNVKLVGKIIGALERTQSRPSIIFSSSIQEDLNSEYGKSKKDGRKLFIDWTEKHNCNFKGLLFPNIFGPNARPNYASVIATFSYQLTHNEIPNIIVDSELGLIYIDDLIKIILECIECKDSKPEYLISFTNQIKVSDVLKKMEYFKSCILDKKTNPVLNTTFELNLFTTFQSYIDWQLD